MLLTEPSAQTSNFLTPDPRIGGTLFTFGQNGLRLMSQMTRTVIPSNTTFLRWMAFWSYLPQDYYRSPLMWYIDVANYQAEPLQISRPENPSVLLGTIEILIRKKSMEIPNTQGLRSGSEEVYVPKHLFYFRTLYPHLGRFINLARRPWDPKKYPRLEVWNPSELYVKYWGEPASFITPQS